MCVYCTTVATYLEVGGALYVGSGQFVMKSGESVGAGSQS